MRAVGSALRVEGHRADIGFKSTGIEGGTLELHGADAFVVRSHRGDYEVRRINASRALAASFSTGDRLVVDSAVAVLHPSLIGTAEKSQTLAVVADETLKSFGGVKEILSWLLDSGFDRSGTIFVAGGGAVQDAVSFAASVFHRGVRWVFIPTTLLSQGDSCIGSKTSINFDGYKNQLGTFYPPSEVWVDDVFLSTLAPKELRSGVGEMLHYGVLGDADDFAVFERLLAGGWQGVKTEDLAELAMRAVSIKRGYIEDDEFDIDRRRNLNFGHTFGHGLEFAAGGAIDHGIAVAYGIAAANDLAWERGELAFQVKERVDRVLETVVDGHELFGVKATRWFEGMSRDKKREGTAVELILLEDLGRPNRVLVSLDVNLEAFLQRSIERWQHAGLPEPGRTK